MPIRAKPTSTNSGLARAEVALCFLVVGIGSLVACVDGLGPNPRVLVTTDSVAYTLSYESGMYNATARVTVTNTLAFDVYYSRCSPADSTPLFGVMRAPPDTTPSSVRVWWACEGGVPDGRLVPDEVVEVDVWLGGHDSGSVPIEHRLGRFLVFVPLYLEEGISGAPGRPLPVESVRSVPFEIRYRQ